jgi:outer membrane protein OmpA-like peptidoglycan-associated protein
MVDRRQIMAATALTALLFTASCKRVVTESKAIAAAPKKKQLPKPSPTAHLIQLPDSAIFVERGSTEEALAAFLGSDAPAPRTFRFVGAEFEPWQSKPNPSTLRTMYAVAQILRAYPHSQVTLVGHTDNIGTAQQNLRLSQDRVDRMAELLVHGGIQARRIIAIGHGMGDPIANNATVEGQARNRRIELVVTEK